MYCLDGVMRLPRMLLIALTIQRVTNPLNCKHAILSMFMKNGNKIIIVQLW